MPEPIEFGDSEPDDAYSAEGEIDVEAVTIRFHEERVNRDDTDLGYWHTLTEEQRAIARIIGELLVNEILIDSDARRVARRIEELREYLGEDVDRGDRREMREQVEEIIDSLRREGTLP